MLEKLITNLKNSLPEPLRKKMGMVQESVDEEEDEGKENLRKYESNDSGESAGDLSDEEKKKKRTSMIIRVVVILGLAYFAVDEFVLKKNPGNQSVDELIAKAPKRKKKKLDDKAAAAAAPSAPSKEEKTSADPKATETTSSAQVPDAPPTTDSTPPIENVNVIDKNEPLAPAVSADTSEVVSTKVVDTSVDNKIDQLVDNVDQSTSAEPAKEIIKETPSNAEMTTSTEEVNIPSQSQTTDKKTPKASESMASKIVEDVSATLPPAYDHGGRGLIYNCKDKYWACVDKAAYVVCNKNMKWNKSQGKGAECAVQNIYNTDEDCAKVQKYNVSIIQPTAFCN